MLTHRLHSTLATTLLFIAVATIALNVASMERAEAKPADDWIRESIARLDTIRPALNAPIFLKGKTARLLLRIKVARSGKIVFVRVVKSSGVAAFDERARRLALQLDSFSPPPPSIEAPLFLDLPIIALPNSF